VIRLVICKNKDDIRTRIIQPDLRRLRIILNLEEGRQIRGRSGRWQFWAGRRRCFRVGTGGKDNCPHDDGENQFYIFHYIFHSGDFIFCRSEKISGAKNAPESEQTQAGDDARVIISQ
jgi:hypothetical protein